MDKCGLVFCSALSSWKTKQSTVLIWYINHLKYSCLLLLLFASRHQPFLAVKNSLLKPLSEDNLISGVLFLCWVFAMALQWFFCSGFYETLNVGLMGGTVELWQYWNSSSFFLQNQGCEAVQNKHCRAFPSIWSTTIMFCSYLVDILSLVKPTLWQHSFKVQSNSLITVLLEDEKKILLKSYYVTFEHLRFWQYWIEFSVQDKVTLITICLVLFKSP